MNILSDESAALLIAEQLRRRDIERVRDCFIALQEHRFTVPPFMVIEGRTTSPSAPQSSIERAWKTWAS